MSRLVFLISVIALFLVLVALVLWPQMDIAVSGLFALPEQGFVLRDNMMLKGLAKIAFYGARVLGVVFIGACIYAFVWKKECLALPAKAWLFLLLCLLIGPGLLANVVFKDNWGRARPRDLVVFGGASAFTPAFVVSDSCKRNCSFVSGDASFGFFLPSFAYVVPRRYGKRVFWGALGLGSLFAGARILLGAHFLSDVLAALALVMAVSAALHALIYKAKTTKGLWKEWVA